MPVKRASSGPSAQEQMDSQPVRNGRKKSVSDCLTQEQEHELAGHLLHVTEAAVLSPRAWYDMMLVVLPVQSGILQGWVSDPHEVVETHCCHDD